MSALVSAGVGVIVVGLRWATVRPQRLLVALLTVVVLDLSRVNQGASHTVPVEMLMARPVLVDALRRDDEGFGTGRFRVLSIKGADARYPEPLRGPLDTAGLSSLTLRQALEVEHNAEFGVESLKVYLPGTGRKRRR